MEFFVGYSILKNIPSVFIKLIDFFNIFEIIYKVLAIGFIIKDSNKYYDLQYFLLL